MFREFKVGELFETHTVSNKLTKAALSLDGTVPVYSSDTRNNGVLGYTEQESTFIVDSVHPTYVIFGDHTRTINILHESFCVMDNVKVLSPKFDLSDEALLYIKTVWLKGIPALGYARHWGVAKDVVLFLPVKPGTDEFNYTEDDIDWAFMESYIQELEESYIQELEESYIQELDAYLKETGLDDYTLTEAEQELLEQEPTFKEFEVGEVFEGVSGDTDIKKMHLDGDGYPVITAGVDNLGVAGYSTVTAKILPENSLTVDMFGNCYFRPFEYKMVTHARVFSLSLKNGRLTPETGLFICTMLQWLRSKYNYSNMCSYNKIKAELIKLPVKLGMDDVNYTDADIDWDYMVSYIRTMEKQVIADVVDYKNEVIATTKKLVKN